MAQNKECSRHSSSELRLWLFECFDHGRYQIIYPTDLALSTPLLIYIKTFSTENHTVITKPRGQQLNGILKKAKCIEIQLQGIMSNTTTLSCGYWMLTNL